MNQEPGLGNALPIQFIREIENHVDFSGVRHRQSIDFDFEKSHVAEIELKEKFCMNRFFLRWKNKKFATSFTSSLSKETCGKYSFSKRSASLIACCSACLYFFSSICFIWIICSEFREKKDKKAQQRRTTSAGSRGAGGGVHGLSKNLNSW